MNKNLCFYPANILLPKEGFEKWAVIACDQFTSNKEYWNTVESTVGDAPSTLRLTLPEIYLSDNNDSKINGINSAMGSYLESGVFEEHPGSMIYVERTQHDGKIRKGIVGAIDLEDYDYHKGARTLIRATEETVPDRLPPRIRIRQNASLELPHVMMLIDDPEDRVIGRLTAEKEGFKKIYDFELMMGGGAIKGYELDENAVSYVQSALASLASGDDPLLFAVGDGNHSLAAAKECYLRDPRPENRYALVEVVNIHDDALVFEPIYRVIFGVSRDTLMRELENFYGDLDAPDGKKITVICGDERFDISPSPLSGLPVGTVQAFVNYLCSKDNSIAVDYVHELDTVKELSAKENTVGFIFDGMKKDELFSTVISDGALPRKTFSMGEGCDKRYYIEARKIK